MKTYKAFDPDFSCLGFKYEVGETYTHEGKIVPCASGFHACANPLDVLKFYPLTSRFAEVEQSGEVIHHDQKTVSSVITIVRGLTLREFIEVAATMNPGATTGDCSPAATTGYRSHAATTGYNSPAATTGYRSHAATTSDYSPAATTGDYSHAATTDDRSPATTTGVYSHAATTDDHSHAATTGYNSPAATTGDHSPATTTGVSSPATTTGVSSPAATTGQWSPAATTGVSSPATTTGENSIAASLGRGSRAKASVGGAIVLAWYDMTGKLRGVKSALVGEDGIKPDTWYGLDDAGKFVDLTNIPDR